jgi:hypothetical protein
MRKLTLGLAGSAPVDMTASALAARHRANIRRNRLGAYRPTPPNWRGFSPTRVGGE